MKNISIVFNVDFGKEMFLFKILRFKVTELYCGKPTSDMHITQSR